jgi:UDP-glucose 4-epimerase
MDAPGTSGEIYNVGSSERVTILELAKRILHATGSASELSFIPYDQVYEQGIEDTLHREPATGKIKDAIGWQTTLDLDQIIADVVEHTRGREPVARP